MLKSPNRKENVYPELELRQSVVPNSQEVAETRSKLGFVTFFDQAKSEIQAIWGNFMSDRFGSDPRIIDHCGSYESFQNLLAKENFRALETLRLKGNSQLWIEILECISDREVAVLELASRHLDEMSDKQVEANLGMKKSEVELMLKLTQALQKPLDRAYIHQVVLAQQPGGKKVPKIRKDSQEYLYGKKPYIQIFSAKNEFPELVDQLANFSKHVKGEVKAGNLPDYYEGLAKFLKTLAASYGSPVTNLKQIGNIWKEVNNQFKELSQSGCPILLTPWAFTVDGGHIGIELMTTLNLGKRSELYTESSAYTRVLKDYLRELQVPDNVEIPFIHQYIMTRSGLDLIWSGTAYAGEGTVNFYDNENDFYADSIYDSYFPHLLISSTKKQRFREVRRIATIAHEGGHFVYVLSNEMYRKMKDGTSLGVLDELKADTNACQLFMMRQNLADATEVSPNEFIEQYVVDYIDEIKSSRGHEDENTNVVWYACDAMIIMHTLFQVGSIRWVGERIQVIDGQAGLDNLAKLGREIASKYGDPKFKSKQVEKYVSTMLKAAKNNPDVIKYLDHVYAL